MGARCSRTGEAGREDESQLGDEARQAGPEGEAGHRPPSRPQEPRQLQAGQGRAAGREALVPATVKAVTTRHNPLPTCTVPAARCPVHT